MVLPGGSLVLKMDSESIDDLASIDDYESALRPAWWGVAATMFAIISFIVVGFAVRGAAMYFLLGFLTLILFVSLPVALLFELRNWLRRGAKTGLRVPLRPFRRSQTRQFSYRTMRGDVVKSRAEVMIADYLLHNNIKYTYESVASTNSLIGRRAISRPDFYLSDYGVYVEYWGMVDHDDPQTRSKYIRAMRWKMAQYHENKIKFISIYPSNLQNLDLFFRTKFNEATGMELPSPIKQIPSNAKYCAGCGAPLSEPSELCPSCGQSAVQRIESETERDVNRR